jgi:hypothetical protein
MIRNLKILGLALIAVFALTASATSMASAQKITSTGPVTLDGTEDGINAFTGFGGKVECPGTVATGHQTLTTKNTEEKRTHQLIQSGSSSFTLTLDLPTSCTVVEGGTAHRATVTMNGCDFDIEVLAPVMGAWPTQSTEVCPTGQDIAIEIYPFSGSELGGVICTITIKPQAANQGVHFLNGKTPEGKWDITATGTYTGIEASRSGSGCASETKTNCELHVNLTIKGTNSLKEQTDATVS